MRPPSPSVATLLRTGLRRAVAAHVTAYLVAIGCGLPEWVGGERVAPRKPRETEAQDPQLLPPDEAARLAEELRQARVDAATARDQAEQANARLAAMEERLLPLLTGPDDGPVLEFGGYVKVDVLASRYSDGDLPSDSIGRDFFVPGTIPVGGMRESEDLDFHARETRLHLAVSDTVGEHVLGAYAEVDFMVSPTGDERVSNSYLPRMRHAYLTWNEWLIGQTWTTFMDVATLPESVDFIGPSGSTSFGRQPLVRHTRGNFAIALENPETTVTPLGGGRIEADDNSLPDLVARYTWASDLGHVQLGGLLRQLSLEDAGLGVDDDELGWGVSLSGKAWFGADDLRWMVIHGDGLGRYVGLNFANGAAITTDGSLEPIGTTSGFVAYRHWWDDRWRSNVVASGMAVDNPVQYTGPDVNRSNWSAQVNLLVNPVPRLTLGIEYLTGLRELESGEDGRLERVQFMASYAF